MQQFADSHGYELTAVPDAHLCCGSAGTYNLMQPEISAKLKDRKIRTLEARKPDVIAAGNIGCMMQIGSGTDVPVPRPVLYCEDRGVIGVTGTVGKTTVRQMIAAMIDMTALLAKPSNRCCVSTSPSSTITAAPSPSAPTATSTSPAAPCTR